MKDTIRMARFDFCAAKPSALKTFLIALAVCIAGALFIMPNFAIYPVFAMFCFTVPLQKKDVGGTQKQIYGILPVGRKSIARGRFLYFFLAAFASELAAMGTMWLALHTALYKLMPKSQAALRQIQDEMYQDNGFWNYGALIGLFACCAVLLSYMEMMGQIKGRENEMRSLVIALTVLIGGAVLFFMLSANGVLPMLSFDEEPFTLQENIILSIIVHLAVIGFTVLFGEITAHVTAKREL